MSLESGGEGLETGVTIRLFVQGTGRRRVTLALLTLDVHVNDSPYETKTLSS